MKDPGVESGPALDAKTARIRDVEPLSSAISALSGILNVDDLLNTAIDRTMELLHAEKGVIHLLNETGQELALHTQRGLSAEYLESYPRLKVGQQAPGKVADIRRPMLVDSSSANTAADALGGEIFRSLVCAPLLSRTGVLGTVSLLREHREPFAPPDLELLSLIARHLSGAVASARLFAEKERRVNDLAVLNEIAQAIGSTLEPIQVLKVVAQKTAQACTAERCSVLLLDGDNSTLLPMMSQFAAGSTDLQQWEAFKNSLSANKVDDIPVVVDVVREGKTVVLDTQSVSRLPPMWIEPFGVKSLLLVPLATREEIIGLMALDYNTEAHRFSSWQVDLATTIGSHVAMAIENARLYARQKRRAVQLDVINRVGRRATSSLNLDELLRETAVAIQEGFDYDFVSILVTDEEKDEIVELADVGRDDYGQVPGYRQSIHQGLIGWAVRKGKPLIVNDVAQDPRYLEGFPDRPFTQSELVVPIQIGPQVVAALDVHSAQLNAFDQSDLMSMQAIADQLSASMRNVRLYEEIKSHLADLEAMNRQLVAIQQAGASLVSTLDLSGVLQSIADSVVQGLGYSVAAIGVLEPETMMVGQLTISGLSRSQLQDIEDLAGAELPGIRIPVDGDGGIIATVLSEGCILTTDRLVELSSAIGNKSEAIAIQNMLDLGTIVTVPLVLDHRPLGALCAATNRTRQVGDEELASLRALASQAILAIQNAQLYERTRARLDELSTLHEISMAATSTLDVDEILARIVGTLHDTLGYSNLGVMLIDQEDNRLKITAGAGYKRDVAERIMPALGEGITGWVALSGLPQNVPDVSLDPRYIMADESIRSEVCVPLAVGNRVIGVLNVESDQVAAFSDDTVRFLSTLAGQVAVVIENARLFQKAAAGEKDWEDTFKAIKDGIAIYNAEFTILRANPALAGILERPLEELIGRRCFEIFSYCEGPSSPTCPHRQAMRTREPTSIEMEEPELAKTLHVFSFPIFDTAGGFKGTVHTVRDITKEKSLRSQLLQTEKLAAIGELVSGVAHELNNPLTSVMGYAQLLQAADVSPEIKEDLQTIYQEAQRSARIIENLLTFARRETAQKRYADVNHILRDTLELRSYQFKVDNIQLVKQLDEHLPWTMVAPQQMQQVFLNLLNNAHQALMESAGPRRVVVTSETKDEVIRIQIADNGPGIPQDVLGKIFDPFFTTKEVGQGTGLGLSIAFGIVQEHGGRIWAESQLEEGSAFIIELPIVAHPLDYPRSSLHEEAAPSHTARRVLLIDDEEEILDVLTRILERTGHQAMALDSAEKALQQIENQEYDIIICDVRMPGLGGKGFYRRVSAAHPELAKRIIFTTGDTLSTDTRAFLESADAPHLPKPFTIEDLQRAINELLAE
jgi:two-component system NtrC family sensor kinase